MHRFFIPPDRFTNDKVLINGDQARQISRVLRMELGDRIVILDNQGYEYMAEIAEAKSDQIIASIIQKKPNTTEPFIDLSLFMSPLKRENSELVLQKCTEIGVNHFYPTLCERTILNPVNWESRVDRWNRIIMEAAEQSHRGIIPHLHQPVKFYDAVKANFPSSYVILASEKEQSNLLVDYLTSLPVSKPLPIAIFIGPEGGFTDEELQLANSNKITSISLGKRILRAETAAIAAAALILCAVKKELR